MLSSLSIRTKVLLLGGLMAIVALSQGAIGLHGLSAGANQVAAVKTIAQALRNHLESDMMHDALRADVLAALRAGRAGDAEALAEVRADLEEHLKEFRERIDANRALQLPPEVADALREVDPSLVRYGEAAAAIVAAAARSADGADARYPGFLDRFRELEEAMAAVSDKIEAEAHRVEEASDATERSARTAMLAALLLGCLAVGMMLLLMVRNLAGPVQRMTRTMRALAAGDLSADVADAGRKDEIGQMADAVRVFRDQGLANQELRSEQAIARDQADAARADALRRLADRVESDSRDTVQTIAARAADLDRSAEALGADAAAMAGSADAAVAATSEASAASGRVAELSAQLSGSIREITAEVSKAAQVVQGTSVQATRAETAISSLAEAVARIGEVARLISDVAGQTNLLALNATIEAARAGEAGKGFAVVAAEVKNLANQTAHSTGEISAQIAAIRAATDAAVDVVRGMAREIRSIDQISSSIAVSVDRQGTATGEIARSVDEALIACQRAADSMSGVADGINATRDRGGQVRDIAAEVANGIETLRHALVHTVRTATSEVDRRTHSRFDIQMPARIESAGSQIDVETIDLSVSGARLAPWAGATIGHEIRVTLPGLVDSVVARLIDVDAQGVGVQFAASLEQQAKLEAALRRRSAA